MEGIRKIRKNEARKVFNAGESIYLLPCRVGFANCWISPMMIVKGEDDFGDFDEQINCYEYYNCHRGLGDYTAFYLKN